MTVLGRHYLSRATSKGCAIPSSYCHVTFLFLVGTLLAQADIIFPLGLSPGDQFRLIFVSSQTHDATSSDISVYDSFINGLVDAAGLGTYDGISVSWHVLVSTPTVNAIDRLPVSAMPIYDLNGDVVWNSGTVIWSGFILHLFHITSSATLRTHLCGQGRSRQAQQDL